MENLSTTHRLRGALTLGNKEYIPVDEELLSTINDIPEEERVDISGHSLEDLVGKEIIILGFTTKPSEFGGTNYFIIEAEFEGELTTINTGSGGVCRQLEAYAKSFPLKVKVCQSGRKFYLD